MNRLFKVSSIAIALSALVGCTQTNTPTYDASAVSQNPIILYSSNELLTMSDKTPIGANSVVVQEGKIVDLGKKETLITKYQSHPSFTIDDQFEDKVITPGFVKTPLTDKNTFPMPFIVDVEEAARIIYQGLGAKKFE